MESAGPIRRRQARVRESARVLQQEKPERRRVRSAVDVLAERAADSIHARAHRQSVPNLQRLGDAGEAAATHLSGGHVGRGDGAAVQRRQSRGGDSVQPSAIAAEELGPDQREEARADRAAPAADRRAAANAARCAQAEARGAAARGVLGPGEEGGGSGGRERGGTKANEGETRRKGRRARAVSAFVQVTAHRGAGGEEAGGVREAVGGWRAEAARHGGCGMMQ